MKKKNRIRRAFSTRCNIRRLGKTRLVVHRTSRHIYAQVISKYGSEVLVSASTLEKLIKKKIKYTGNKESAATIGKIIAERSIKKGIKFVSFDRSGFKYHGRIKALANAARLAGLNF